MNFRKEVEKYKDDFLNDLNNLVSIESTYDPNTSKEGQPFGEKCREALDCMLEMGQRDGFETKDVEGYAGVITYGQQEETFGILGHLDIVPIGDDWTKQPLQVTENDGYIFGRGVLDDKGPALAAYYALKMVRDLNIPLKKRIMMITGCDEESNMRCMDYYKKHEEVPQMGFVPDADFPVIYAEKGGLHVELSSNDSTCIVRLDAGTRPNIVIGKADCYVTSMNDQQRQEFAYYCKTNHIQGSIEECDGFIKLHVDGVFAHAAMPWLGNNAALHLLNYIASSYQDQLAKDLYSLLYDWQGKPLGIDIDGMYMGFLTLNVGMIRMNESNTNIVLDIRYPNDVTGPEIVKKIQAACDGVQSNLQVAQSKDSIPLFVDPNSDLVTSLMASYQKYTDDTFSCPLAIGGGTYARKFDNFVSFGPELPNDVVETEQFVGGCHQRDEGIKLENLLNSIAIYADAIVTLCS